MIWADLARLRIRVPSEAVANDRGRARAHERCAACLRNSTGRRRASTLGLCNNPCYLAQTMRTVPGRTAMARRRELCSIFAAIGILGSVVATPGSVSAQTIVAIDADDIGGVVMGPNGPEAGVWVIAETTDLPTRFARTVVTDDQGRYVLPDLPKATYQVWVRGYGLVDSPKMTGEPGRLLDLQAVPAPSDKEAAQYYPAIYWYSMLKIPEASQFGGKSDIPENITPDRLAQAGQEHRLHRLPPARPALDPHHPKAIWASSAHPRKPGSAGVLGPIGREHGQPARRPLRRACRSSTTPTGRTALHGASCRMPSRSDRRVSSATSW